MTLEFVCTIMPAKYQVIWHNELGYLAGKKLLHTSKFWIFEDLNTFSLKSRDFLSKDREFSDNFRNGSNFEELYLRAQGIFFDGTGTIVKIYV